MEAVSADFQGFNQSISNTLETLTTEEADQEFNNLKRHLPSDEKVISVVSDRSLTSKQKLTKIYELMTQEKFGQFLSGFQETINQVGFEKAFSDLAQTYRSRQKEFEETFSDIVQDHAASYTIGDRPGRLTHEGKVFLWTVGIGLTLLFVGEAISPGVGRAAYTLTFVLFIYWFLNWTYGYTI